MLDGRPSEGNKTFEAPGGEGPGRGTFSKLVRGPGGRIQPDRSRLLLLMIGPARRTLADVPLAAFSFESRLSIGGKIWITGTRPRQAWPCSPASREAATEALAIDSSRSTDIQTLVTTLASGDAGQRAEAAELLCRAGAAAGAAAVPLIRACADDDDQVREWAVAALEELGPPPAGSTPALGELAAAGHPLVSYWAITLLGRSGQDAASAATVLAGCLKAADLSVAQQAAWALCRIGPAAGAARDALRAAAASSDPRLARLAGEALDSAGA